MGLSSVKNWTNKSVLGFAEDQDPIIVMENKAQNVALAAMENGWSGPPYDPIELAKMLGYRIQQNASIKDARTKSEGDNLIIEFNPNRSRGRIRFSVAHEIAHTFFEDCKEETRYRTHRADGDNWQLETLCNIGAAELIMPIGSDIGDRKSGFSIKEVLELRKEYDVSTEAILIRYAKLTSDDLSVFCASRVNETDEDSPYRIDYSVESSSWSDDSLQGTTIDPSSAISECTAIGIVGETIENWNKWKSQRHIEFVGLPPYPGSLYPRVAGFAWKEGRPKPNNISVTFGDACSPKGSGNKIIAHIVNNATPNWGGAGFAVSLKKRYPEAQKDFKNWAISMKDQFRLGGGWLTKVDNQIFTYSMIAQQGYKYKGKPLIRYSALRESLQGLAEHALFHGASVHMPRIGIGNARGNWSVIEELIREKLVDNGIDVQIYDFVPNEM